MPNIRKKKIQKLRRDIEDLNRKMIRADTVEEWHDVNAAELNDRDYLEEDLNVLETQELQEKSQPFGINLFPSEGKWGDPELWNTTRDGRRILTKAGLARAKSQIIDARFSYWKRWIDIVAPVASTIISIIALIIAIIALNR